MYHRIADKEDDYYCDDIAVKKSELIKQLQFFKKRFCCISMSEAVSMINSSVKLDKDFLVFTFDDGYMDNIKYGLNLFKQFKVNPIIYVTANKVETKEPIWTEIVDRLVVNANVPYLDISINGKRIFGKLDSKKEIFECAGKVKAVLFEMPQREIYKYLKRLQQTLGVETFYLNNGLLSWNDVRLLVNAGCEIGSHTMNHINCSIESIEIVSNELEESLKLIERRIGSKVDHFAYPFGKKSKEFTICDLIKMNYLSAVTISEGINKCGSDVYHLKRIKISNHHNLLDVRTKLLKVKIIDFFKSIIYIKQRKNN